MSTDRLMAQLDGAELVKYDPDGYLLAWYGGQSTGVHVYDGSGAEIAYWQIEETAYTESHVSRRERILTSMNEHAVSGEPYPA